MEWVNVDESLPIANKRVLVCRIGKTSYQPFFAVRKNRDVHPWEWPDGDTCHRSITHWCYLPEMPTK
jgi:hypothetical protein